MVMNHRVVTTISLGALPILSILSIACGAYCVLPLLRILFVARVLPSVIRNDTGINFHFAASNGLGVSVLVERRLFVLATSFIVVGIVLAVIWVVVLMRFCRADDT